MPNQWTPVLMNTLIELETRNYSHSEIAQEMYSRYPDLGSVPTKDAIRHALDRAREKVEFLKDRALPERTPYYTKYRSEIRGDVIVEKNATALETFHAKPVRKILVLSDLHVPFTDEDKLQKAIDLHRSADAVVLSGDVLDMYSCSKWRKRKYVPHELEIDAAVRLFEYLSSIFPIIFAFPGNHDKRPTKKLQDVVPPEFFYMFEDTDTLGMITRAFPNVHYEDNWFLQLGDAIFTHAERSSAVEGRPAVLTAEFFLQKGWAEFLGLTRPRLIVQGHTHQVSATYRYNLKMIESGCLAQTMEYTLDASAVMRPPMTGCVLVTQRERITDFNETRETIL
jgi:predicted phosphodiesterase